MNEAESLARMSIRKMLITPPLVNQAASEDAPTLALDPLDLDCIRMRQCHRVLSHLIAESLC
jgi:hypothetical protein